MITDRILKYPGFLYELGGRYYFLGKWICKECTDTDATDCVFMYRMNRKEKENTETNLFFQKIRAYADFALEVPYNPSKIKEDMTRLLKDLSDTEASALQTQLDDFEEDYRKFCAEN